VIGFRDGAVVTAVEGELLLQAAAVRTTSTTGKKFLMTPFPKETLGQSGAGDARELPTRA
jgi:hypothetical protein